MSDNINSMNYKQLRNEVQLLRDELAIMKRKYEDILYNLDTDNFSQRVVKQGKDMYTKIEQTAEKITLQAEAVKELDDKVIATQANITVKADEILSTVSETYQTKADAKDKANKLESQISQTAEKISTKVSKNIAAHFKSDDNPNYLTTITDTQKAMLCLYDDKYYYYDDYSETWLEYPAEGLQTMFEQTASKFTFTGDVEISGDAVVGGTIKGLTISTADNILGDGVRLNSDNNSLEVLYNGSVVGRWGYTTMPGGSSIYPVSGGTLSIANATASGNWDFSSCTITNWGSNAPVAVFG